MAPKKSVGKSGKPSVKVTKEPKPKPKVVEEVVSLSLDLVVPYKDQPRSRITPESLKELTTDIKKNGILVPIVVRPHPKKDGYYQIAAGDRRSKAAGMAGLQYVPAIIRHLTDEELDVVSLVDNIQRQDLHPIDEARHIKKIMDRQEIGAKEVAVLIGKEYSWVNSLRLSLLRLGDEVSAYVLDQIDVHSINTKGLLAINQLENEEDRLAVAQTAVRLKMSGTQIEKYINKHIQDGTYNPRILRKAKIATKRAQKQRALLNVLEEAVRGMEDLTKMGIKLRRDLLRGMAYGDAEQCEKLMKRLTKAIGQVERDFTVVF